MQFDIRFTGPTARGNLRPGRIVLDDFTELFEAPLGFWSAGQYKRHWREAIARLADGETRSALVTSMYDPDTANFVVWWPMYRRDASVIIRNQILFLDQIQGVFDASRLFSYIPERREDLDAECPPSEWVIDLDSMRPFLDGA